MTTGEPTVGDLMTGPAITVPKGASVAKALALMRRGPRHELPVLERERLVGMVTLDAIAQRTNLPLTAKVENLLTLPPRLSPEATWEEAATTLLKSGLRAVPVVDRAGVLRGVVSRSDLVRAFPIVSRLSDARAADVASPLAGTVGERDPVGELIGRVRDEAPIAVVDSTGRLVGSIGIADLSGAFWRPNAAGKGDRPRARGNRGTVLQVEARTIMRPWPLTASPQTPALQVARQMGRRRASSAFVVQSGRPVAAITQCDLMELAVGGHPSRAPLGEVYVRFIGLPVQAASGFLEEIDRVIARGMSRIARRLRPVLLDVHVSPHGVHRTGRATVSLRLHTPGRILRAERSTVDILDGLREALRELDAQCRRVVSRRTHPARTREQRRRATREGLLP